MDFDSIGLCELSSIGMGYYIQDVMLKASAVELLLARTICSGKYLILVAGTASTISESVDAAINSGEDTIIEHKKITGVHPDIFPALSCSVGLSENQIEALGVLETFSVSTIIEAADAAVKAADVKLFRVYTAMAIGGKGYFLITGDVASVTSAIDAGVRVAQKSGLLTTRIVIPSPRPELFRDYI